MALEGAVGIAALLHNKISNMERNVAVVLSGGNVELTSFLEAVRGWK